MKLKALMQELDKWDQRGVWIFSSATIRRLFPNESPRGLQKALADHQEAGVICRVARGLYLNPKSRRMPPDILTTLVAFLRPWDVNYLSLESALSDAGMISQIPSRLTVMTTGRSQIFETPFGTIEFTHTARAPSSLRDDVAFDATRRMLVARPKAAVRDLKRVGRNVDLIMGAMDDTAA
ncbi:MAG: hypothetical protein JO171_08285 [Paludibacterium sp.]|uniref:type IV toxin-antitoxin system AbiEi family antitoxin n=1 Tax=Paludibacterium sp. TaxID=1917523 RepID=UPI0025DACFF9|nr:hypothetical protein [Paludibacterium sp.]MBV8047135.1 hypothetical protein [Paludibacterium sp.]MBV8648734.1 hypothetical protein [Paludibacterium sp.]